MKVAVFTTYNATPSNPNMYEFVEKNTNFLCDIFDEVTYINLIHRKKNDYIGYLQNSLKKYNLSTKVSCLDIEIDSLFESFIREERINPKEMDKLSKYIPQLEEFDCIFTFGNFVTFRLNNDSNKSRLTFNDLTKYNFDLSVPYYINFMVMNELFQKVDTKKIQFFSDPLDISFDGFTKATPDTQNKDVFDVFLPLYQYFYNTVAKPSSEPLKKSNVFVMGNSCGDEYRKYLFDRYVLAFYEEHKEDERYKFYASGYKNHNVVLDNFINHNDFYTEVEKSLFGLVLNTYSKDFISANKISMMLSRNCLPIITTGSDDNSNYLPEWIKDIITVNSSVGLNSKIADYSEKNVMYYVAKLKEYYSEFNYLEIIKEIML